MSELPIKEARNIAQDYGWDQVIIVARRVGDAGYEHVVTYGKDKANCEAAARAGQALKHHLMRWPSALWDSGLRVLGISRDGEFPKSVSVYLGSVPTDDEIRTIHEFLKPPTASPADVENGA